MTECQECQECQECGTELPRGATACVACGNTDVDAPIGVERWASRASDGVADGSRTAREPGPRLGIRIGEVTWMLDDGEECLIGRDQESPFHVVLDQQYRTVSRLHATVSFERGVARVRDEGSKHGTFDGGERLTAGTEHKVPLPSRIRLAFNCHLDLFSAGPLPGCSDDADPRPMAGLPSDEDDA
jgi:pSer/pThr/pTyr-binding forkhead associated (FHA) protein